MRVLEDKVHLIELANLHAYSFSWDDVGHVNNLTLGARPM